MNCRDFKGIMVEYCEESLPVATRESVETHLASCVRCRGRLAEWTRIERTLGQAMTAPYPSPGFSRRLRAALAATESARRPAPRRLFFAALPRVAAAAAVIGLGLAVSVALRTKDGRRGAAPPAGDAVAADPTPRPFASGPPAMLQTYVAGRDGLVRYEGRTSVRIRTVAHDVLELTVDAFPAEPRDASQGDA
jgi:anti-sigma factor RsiW